MKTVGIIGGVGPESTIEYYRMIIGAYRERRTDGGYPSIIINSVDVNRLLAWMKVGDLTAVSDYLVTELQRLARAGASFGVIAANTPHIVFDELQARSPISLLSIVEATRDEATARGMKKIGLFGTRYTMQGQFYPEVFSRAGLQIIVPNDEEQSYIHEKYLGELLNNVFSPVTRAGLLAIVGRMKDRDGIEGLILGGTELPLILRDAGDNGLPFLDTTKIHVERIVAELLS
jgi:aspartate racemase